LVVDFQGVASEALIRSNKKAGYCSYYTKLRSCELKNLVNSMFYWLYLTTNIYLAQS